MNEIYHEKYFKECLMFFLLFLTDSNNKLFRNKQFVAVQEYQTTTIRHGIYKKSRTGIRF